MDAQLLTDVLAQHGLEGVALVIFVWFVRGFFARVGRLATSIEKVSEAHSEHIVKEERHHERVATELKKQTFLLERQVRPNSDNTPVTGIPTS